VRRTYATDASLRTRSHDHGMHAGLWPEDSPPQRCSTYAAAWPCPSLQRGQMKLSRCCSEDLEAPTVGALLYLQLSDLGASLPQKFSSSLRLLEKRIRCRPSAPSFPCHTFKANGRELAIPMRSIVPLEPKRSGSMEDTPINSICLLGRMHMVDLIC
jgi:hypothetical protein